MSSRTGKQYRINYKNKTPTTPVWEGFGVVRRPRTSIETTSLKEPGTGTRQLTILKQSHSTPRIGIDYDFQTGKFISGYVLTRPPQSIPLSGTDYAYYDGCSGWRLHGDTGHPPLVNTCRVSCRVDESVKVSVDVIGKHWLDGFSGTASNMPVTESGVRGKACWADTKILLGCVSGVSSEVTNWTEWEFNINNNVATQQLGRDVYPSEVYDQQVEYNGRFRRSIRCGQPEKFSLISGGVTASRLMFVISGADGQCWRYCFSGVLYTVSRTEVSDLDIAYETIEWEAPYCSGWAR